MTGGAPARNVVSGAGGGRYNRHNRPLRRQARRGDGMLSRRGFFRTAITASGGVLCGASAVSALTLDAEPSTDLTQLYHAAKAACGGATDAYHGQLLADAEAVLADRQPTEEERQRLLASVTCPICGCSVAGS
jgi:hypothetical protein